MDKLKHIVVAHRAALLLALLMSIIVATPQIAFRMEHRSDGIYKGIELLPDSSWPPRVREIMDGHGFGAIYYKEGKSDPYLFQPVGSAVVAYMGKLFSFDINNTLLLARFVLSFAVFLVVYVFVYLFSRDKLAALSGASVLLLADAATDFSGLKSLLRGVSPSDFLTIGLPVNPAMIYIPFFAFLAAYWLFYQKNDWRWGAVSAALLGLNFYTYFYSWTYLYAFGGFLGLIYLLRLDWREALRIGSVYVGGLVLAIPYGINLYYASQYSTFADVGVRKGIVFTHEPLFVGAVVIIGLLVYVFGFPKEENRKYVFGLALLLAPFVTLNQQLLTGKIMQEAHYHWYFHKPIAIIFVLLVAFYLLGRLRTAWYKWVLGVALVVASFAIGVFTQVDSYLNDYGDGGKTAVDRQKYGPVMDWLNQNAQKEEVLLATDTVSYMASIYTPLNFFYHRAGLYSLSATNERLLDSLFTFYRLRGVGKSDAREVFFADKDTLSKALYGIYYRELLGSYDAIPDDKVEEMLALYEASLAIPTPQWLKDIFKKYEVNYVVWDKKADPAWVLDRYPFLIKEATFGEFVLYRFVP